MKTEEWQSDDLSIAESIPRPPLRPAPDRYMYLKIETLLLHVKIPVSLCLLCVFQG